MSRHREWSNAYNGIIQLISNSQIGTNPFNLNVEYNIINKYCRINKLKGSFSERILLIKNNFRPFRDYVKSLEALRATSLNPTPNETTREGTI